MKSRALTGQGLKSRGTDRPVGAYRVITEPADLQAVRQALADAQIPVDSSDLTMLPATTVEVSDPGVAGQVLNLVDALDDLDDVQDVYANFDISDELLECPSQ